MKLRNKKTGGLANILGEQDFFRVYTDAGWADYNSLAELNEEWEDYKSTEPLIKDEKIRKAVRAWAEVNDVGRIKYNLNENSLTDIFRNELSFNQGLELEDECFYNIAELCGEEEE